MEFIEVNEPELNELQPGVITLGIRVPTMPNGVEAVPIGHLKPELLPERAFSIAITEPPDSREVTVAREDGTVFQIARMVRSENVPEGDDPYIPNPTLMRAVGHLTLSRQPSGIWLAQQNKGGLEVLDRESFSFFWIRLAEGVLRRQGRRNY